MSEFADPAAEDVPDEVAAMFDLSLKKKKKKKDTKSKSDGAAEGDAAKESTAEGAASGEVASSSSGAGVFELDPPTYSYTQLLNRVVDSLQQNNPEITDKKRITMKPPQLMRGRSLFNAVVDILLQTHISNSLVPLHSWYQEDPLGELPGNLQHNGPKLGPRLSVHDG
jgi:hypothetical protein